MDTTDTKAHLQLVRQTQVAPTQKRDPDAVEVVRLLDHNVRIAAQIDTHIQEIAALIEEMRINGQAAEQSVRKVVDKKRQSAVDVMTIRDKYSGVDFVTANDRQTTMAMVSAIRYLLAALQSPTVENFIQMNSFEPITTCTFEQAMQSNVANTALFLGKS